MHLRNEFSCMTGSKLMSYDAVLDQLDSSKSPGYPWTLKYRKKFDYWLSPDALFFDKYYAALGTDNPINTVASVTIKEELREVKKIEDNNVRTIASVDVNHLVAHSILMMDQNEKLLQNNLKCSSALGLSLMYGGAHKLFEYLTPWGDIKNIMSIDGKKYDSKFNVQSAELIYNFRYDCLSTEFKNEVTRKRFENIQKQIWTAPLVDIDGHIYDKETGNLSGQGATTPDNILKNWLDFFFIWLIVAPEKWRNYESFKQFVRCAFVGDDAIIAVHPNCQGFYNPASITKVSDMINMTYEFESQEFEHFKDCSFVGHKFILTKIPKTEFKMYLPHIDCVKMRTSFVRYNTTRTLYASIIRCNGLRMETFACDSCRVWFNNAYIFLRDKLPVPHTAAAKQALSTYFTDDQLWEIYSNVTLADIYCREQEIPANKIRYYPQRQSINSVIMPTEKKKRRQRKKKPAIKLTKEEIANIKKQIGFKKINFSGVSGAGTRVKGRGDYTLSDIGKSITKPFLDDTKSVGTVNKIARSVGRIVGGTVLPGMGNEIGNAASWLSRAFGFGDYKIKANSLMTQNIAQFKAHGTIEFSHREFVSDINMTTNFQNSTYIINAGNSTLFPWLSTIAKNFEQYEFMGLIFEFKSTSASAIGNTTTGLGTIIMATDYDVLDSPYADKRAMEVAEFATSGPPCVNQIHPIECDPRQNIMSKLYIKPGNTYAAPVGLAPADDWRFSTMGNFQLATTSAQAACSGVGELWVSYHVKLYKPQLEGSSSGAITKIHAGLSVAIGGSPTLSFVESNNSGAFTVSLASGRLRIAARTDSATGTYLVTMGVVGSISDPTMTITGTPYFLSDNTSCILPYYAYSFSGSKNQSGASFTNFASTKASSVAGISCNPACQSYIIQFLNATGSCTLPIPYSAANNCYVDVYMAPYALDLAVPDPTTARLSKDEIEISELRKEFELLKMSITPTPKPEEVVDCESDVCEDEYKRIRYVRSNTKLKQ